MKRTFSLLIASVLLAAVAFSGCSGASPAASPSPASSPSTTVSSQAVTSAAPETADPSASTDVSPANNAGPLTEADFVFTIDGDSFPIDSLASTAIEYFGDEYVYSQSETCFGQGPDKVYDYPQFSLYCYDDGNNYLILEILLVEREYETLRGIKVGDTIEQVTDVYGEGEWDDISEILIYDFGAVALWFYSDGGTVTAIDYCKGSGA